MNKIVSKHYEGFEGEPEIQFTQQTPKGNNLTVRIWEGYFDSIMSAIQPTAYGWSGLSYYYHLHEGWYEESPWKIPNLNRVIDEFKSIDKTELDSNTNEVFKDILMLLINAEQKKDIVLISYY